MCLTLGGGATFSYSRWRGSAAVGTGNGFISVHRLNRVEYSPPAPWLLPEFEFEMYGKSVLSMVLSCDRGEMDLVMTCTVPISVHNAC